MLKLLASVAFLFAPCAGAQTIHIVDDESALNLQVVLDQASDGDVILLRTAAIPNFTVSGKGLTILNDFGGPVSVVPVTTTTPCSVSGLPEGSSCTLRGLTITGTTQTFPFSGFSLGLVIEDCAGSVWIEDCDVVPTATDPGFGDGSNGGGALIRDCPDVVVTGCRFEGNRLGNTFLGTFADGLIVEGSRVFISDSAILGGDASAAACGPFFDCSPSTVAGDGVSATDSTLSLLGTELRGGAGEDAGSCVGTTASGAEGSSGGTGIDLAAGVSQVILTDCVLSAGGFGLGSGGCADGVPGQLIVQGSSALSEPAVAARTLTMASPVRSGQLESLSYGGEPGDLVFGALSGGQSWSLFDGFSAAVALDLAGLELFPLGTPLEDGTFTGSLVFPDLADVPTYRLQAVAIDAKLNAAVSSPTVVTVLPAGS